MGREKGAPGRSRTRPSSSSLAGAQTGVAPLGFGGYVGSSLVETTLPAEREVSQDLDGEAALHLKRLSKRDPTTKLKALAALRGIFKEHSVDELAAILLTWVFEYKRLVQDNNRQVRENTHGAMADLTTNAGRGLARHLKSLMGAWWVSQFDPSREVAEAAQRSFQVTFPDRRKRVDVLIFCLKDIMVHLDENLKLTPQILTEMGALPEEVTEKLERILSSSLLALAALLDVLVGSTSSPLKEGPAESTSAAGAAVGAGEAAKEAAISLFHKHKSFQSSVKNKSSQVRSAVYQTLRTYVQHIPQVFTDEDNLDNSVKLVLGALGEKETSCHQPMWDMVLIFSKNIPQAWGSNSIRKAILPKLWEFLRQGCFGSQQISYPCIYPLLALIPPQFVAPPQGFFLEFFSRLWQGVYVPALSTADRRSFFKTFQECFVGVVVNAKRYAKETDCKTLQDFLVDEVLFKIVWCQYANVASQDQDSTNAAAKSAHSHPVLLPPVSDDVARTIVDILIVLGQKEDLLDAFWPGLQTSCVSILLDKSSENGPRLARLEDFFSLLHEKLPEKENTNNSWLLQNVVQPFVAKGFPAIRHSGHPEALRLLGKLIATYGTSAFASQEQVLGDSIRRRFLQEVVPWCLSGEDEKLIEPKLDLLLSFFEVKEFHCYWKSTIECAAAWLRPGEERSDLDDKDLLSVGVLATAVGKFSERWARLANNAAEHDTVTNMLDLWRLPRLDAAALAVASSNNLLHPACVRLLRSLLSPQSPEESLLSPDTTTQLMEILSRHLIKVLLLHDTQWTRAAPSFILSEKVDSKLTQIESDDGEKLISFELARSALDVVEVIAPALGAVQSSGPQLLCTLFCLYWAFLQPLSRKVTEDDSDESEDERRETDGVKENTSSEDVVSTHHHMEQSRLSFLNCLANLRRSSSSVIHQKLGRQSREHIRRILTEVVRSALVLEESSDTVPISTLCADWVSEMVDYFCTGEDEIQDTISCTLAPRLSWPSWVQDTHNAIPIVEFPWKTTLVKQDEVHQRFCAYADVLARNLGPESVYAGRTSMSSDKGTEEYRIWLVIELLCSWEWRGGSASQHPLEFLCNTARNATGQKLPSFLDMCFRSLIAGSTFESSDRVAQEGSVGDDLFLEMGPSTNALLTLLRALVDGEAVWKRIDAEQFFFEYIAKADVGADAGLIEVLPSLLLTLMPVLRNPLPESSNAESSEGGGQALKHTVCDWLDNALTLPPLADIEGRGEAKGYQWLEVAIACFPLQLPGVSSGITAASKAKISLQETSLLLRLLRKQFRMAEGPEPQLTSGMMLHRGHELTLAQLVAVSVAYCWQDFGVEEWAFILKCFRKWVDLAVVEFEELAEIVVNFYEDGQQGALDIQQLSGRRILIKLAAAAVSALILLKDLNKLETVTALRALGTLRVSNWVAVEDHMMEALLRILLATGLSEAAAMDFNVDGEAAKTISKHRRAEAVLWESLGVVALGATNRAREAAVRAADLWGVGKGSISALYALLLSPNSTRALQWVAFQFLSTEPIQQLAVTWAGVPQTQAEADEGAAPEAAQDEASLAAAAKLRPELAKLLETPEKLLLQSSFTSDLRVQYLLGWSLLLMRLHALPPLSPVRERLLQFARDSDISSTLLDCLFQHIPLDLTSGTSASRRRTAVAGAKINSAATAATRAVSTGTVSFAVEHLWPVKEESVVVLAGAVYGLLLRVLPACVRIWFTGLRDRSTASAIENFTSSNCSTYLLADEFSQLQASVIADETLSIRANRTLREATAVYKKEEACLDIVIRLPSCYPLRAVEVDCTRRLGISETLLRKWILSMASFLRNQNGALLEAIQMWKKNVDREFEGVEECPICYSIIHTTNHSLPRLACKTCKHKFHSACLYKWFSTSHKSTCPLCQTPF